MNAVAIILTLISFTICEEKIPSNLQKNEYILQNQKEAKKIGYNGKHDFKKKTVILVVSKNPKNQILVGSCETKNKKTIISLIEVKNPSPGRNNYEIIELDKIKNISFKRDIIDKLETITAIIPLNKDLREKKAHKILKTFRAKEIKTIDNKVYAKMSIFAADFLRDQLFKRLKNNNIYIKK